MEEQSLDAAGSTLPSGLPSSSVFLYDGQEEAEDAADAEPVARNVPTVRAAIHTAAAQARGAAEPDAAPLPGVELSRSFDSEVTAADDDLPLLRRRDQKAPHTLGHDASVRSLRGDAAATSDPLEMSLLRNASFNAESDVDEFEALERLVQQQVTSAPSAVPAVVHNTSPARSAPRTHLEDEEDISDIVAGFRRSLRTHSRVPVAAASMERAVPPAVTAVVHAQLPAPQPSAEDDVGIDAGGMAHKAVPTAQHDRSPADRGATNAATVAKPAQGSAPSTMRHSTAGIAWVVGAPLPDEEADAAPNGVSASSSPQPASVAVSRTPVSPQHGSRIPLSQRLAKRPPPSSTTSPASTAPVARTTDGDRAAPAGLAAPSPVVVATAPDYSSTSALTDLVPHAAGSTVVAGAPLSAVVPPPLPAAIPAPARVPEIPKPLLLSQIEAKVAALDAQISKYQDEVVRLQDAQKEIAREKQELDEQTDALTKERNEFKSWKAAEVAKLDAWKAEVIAKMDRERRVAVRQARAAAAAAVSGTDRQEKAETEELRSQVQKLKAELQAADARYKSSVERHRASAAVMQDRIKQLEEQVRAYESRRLTDQFGPSTETRGDSGDSSRRSSSGHAVNTSSRGAPMRASGSVRSSSLEPRGTGASRSRGAVPAPDHNVDAAGTSVASSYASRHQARRGPGATASTPDAAPAQPRHAADVRVKVVHHVHRPLEHGADDGGRYTAIQDRVDATAEYDYNPGKYSDAVDTLASLAAEATTSNPVPVAVATPPRSPRREGGKAPPAAAGAMSGSSLPNLRASGAVAPPVLAADPPTAPAAALADLTSSSAASSAVSAVTTKEASAAHRHRSLPADASEQLRRHVRMGITIDTVAFGLEPSSSQAATQRDIGGDKHELVFPSGMKRVVFRNGTVKDVDPDGTVVIRFNNGDVKRTQPLRSGGAEMVEFYYYADSKTLQATYPDKIDVYEFESGQLEVHHHAVRSKEVVFPDGTRDVFAT